MTKIHWNFSTIIHYLILFQWKINVTRNSRLHKSGISIFITCENTFHDFYNYECPEDRAESKNPQFIDKKESQYLKNNKKRKLVRRRTSGRKKIIKIWTLSSNCYRNFWRCVYKKKWHDWHFSTIRDCTESPSVSTATVGSILVERDASSSRLTRLTNH